jgi:hypothetical protein
MSQATTAATTVSSAQRLASDLLQRARRTFATLAAEERGPALLAIDAFLAAPTPATYLAATRVLAAVRRQAALQRVRAAHAGYALARGLSTVRYELGAAQAEALAAQPSDDRTGHRLRALALLAAAHRELSERVAGSTGLLRRQLALSRERASTAPRRRPPPKASRRRPPL